MSDEAKIKLQKNGGNQNCYDVLDSSNILSCSEILNISFTKVYLLFYIFSLMSQSTLL